MKKDFFNGNIKREYVSCIWATIIIVALVFFGCGGLFLYFSLFGNTDNNASFLLLVFGVVSCLVGVWCSFGTFFFIRQYPKHKKMTKLFLNSDCYFVDSDSKEYHGHWRGHAAFNAVTAIAEQNKGLEDIKYPKKLKIYFALALIGIALMFVFIFITVSVTENIELLPKALQNEYLIFSVLAIVEVVDVVLSFVFAFRVKRIRGKTIDEYRAERKNESIRQK